MKNNNNLNTKTPKKCCVIAFHAVYRGSITSHHIIIYFSWRDRELQIYTRNIIWSPFLFFAVATSVLIFFFFHADTTIIITEWSESKNKKNIEHKKNIYILYYVRHDEIHVAHFSDCSQSATYAGKDPSIYLYILYI